jgi:hypothetical protein
MVGVLLNACPSFAPQWQAFVEEWQEEADDLPLYLTLADFARHVISMAERGDTAGLPAIFAAITFTRPTSRSYFVSTSAQYQSAGRTSCIGSGSMASYLQMSSKAGLTRRCT